MPSGDSSRGKRSKKAATPSPSTTSSTTGPTSPGGGNAPPPLEADGGRAGREALLRLLLRGASPAAACAQLGIAPQVFLTWLDDPEFRRRIAQSQDLLSQNVAAALYRSAMEGSVAAQTFYLRHLPPPEWSLVASAQKVGDPLNQLSDDELLDFCRARGIDLSLSPVEGGDAAADAAESA